MRAARVLRAGWLSLALGGVACSIAPASAQQKLYKYQDQNGTWTFTDMRPPAGQSYAETEIERRFETPDVRLFKRTTAEGIVLIAANTYHAPVQLAYRLSELLNVAPRTPLAGRATLAPRSEVEVLAVGRQDRAAPISFSYELQYLPGSPDAEHRPQEPYRLPYAQSRKFRVTQAFPSTITHNDIASVHAVDFEMPVGTAVLAARDGVVIEVASNYYTAGSDLAVHGPRANVVRVLHADGTMALYAHLNWNSIRVVPGQRVARGEYLADSGNTGFSTGPHLHFVVQRNRDGELVSVPVEFVGAGGAPVTLESGASYVAY